MDHSRRYMDEFTDSGLEHFLTVRSRLHSDQARHHIDRGLMTAMMMPTCGHARFGKSDAGPHTFYRDRLLSDYAWTWIGTDTVFPPDASYSLALHHLCMIVAKWQGSGLPHFRALSHGSIHPQVLSIFVSKGKRLRRSSQCPVLSLRARKSVVRLRLMVNMLASGVPLRVFG